MEIKVLGPGCANCRRMEELTKQAVRELGINVEVVKITDIGDIARWGILSTPGLIVNGKAAAEPAENKGNHKSRSLTRETFECCSRDTGKRYQGQCAIIRFSHCTV